MITIIIITITITITIVVVVVAVVVVVVVVAVIVIVLVISIVRLFSYLRLQIFGRESGRIFELVGGSLEVVTTIPRCFRSKSRPWNLMY